jgi:hypothetical protein
VLLAVELLELLVPVLVVPVLVVPVVAVAAWEAVVL